jgi:1,4-dihydroxy-2-naphthoate octaprenyltransferase
MSRPLGAWLRAARPLAHANVAPPILLGQALAASAGTAIDPGLFVVAHAFGVLDHLFIVFANDYADRALDADNDTYSPFSGGSRVLPEGLLAPASILRAAIVSAAMLVALTLGAASVLARPLAPLFALAALALLWAYSYRPLALSYRGGGELLQGLGLGAVLPLWGFYVQRGAFDGFPWLALAPLVVLNAAGNVLTALPDAPSDARGGKRTWPVLRGERAARLHAWLALAVSVLAIAALVAGRHGPLPGVAVALAPLAGLAASLAWIREGDARSRAACLRFVLAGASAIGTVQLGWALVALATP